MEKNRTIDEQRKLQIWERVFNIVKYNPILFLERYYNAVEPEEYHLELTREQKQHYYNKYKGIPVIQAEDMVEFGKKLDERRQSGKEDWEL